MITRPSATPTARAQTSSRWPPSSYTRSTSERCCNSETNVAEPTSSRQRHTVKTLKTSVLSNLSSGTTNSARLQWWRLPGRRCRSRRLICLQWNLCSCPGVCWLHRSSQLRQWSSSLCPINLGRPCPTAGPGPLICIAYRWRLQPPPPQPPPCRRGISCVSSVVDQKIRNMATVATGTSTFAPPCRAALWRTGSRRSAGRSLRRSASHHPKSQNLFSHSCCAATVG